MKRQRVCACEGHTLDRLLQPLVMALLVEEPAHGYALVDRLKDSPMMNGAAPDPTGLYRLLNNLEEQGLVTHAWSESEEGPSKRLYELTDQGKCCVGKWIETLDRYRDKIGQLVEMLRSLNQSGV